MLPFVMMKDSNELFMKFGSTIATIMLIKAIYEQYIPYQWRESLHAFFMRYSDRAVRFFSPYLNITFDEFTGEWFDRSNIYLNIQTYLSENSSRKARGLKASAVSEDEGLVLGLADNEEVTDEFQGVKVWWTSAKHVARSQTISYFPGADDKRYYRLTFHGRHRKLITESYLKHVLEAGKAIAIKNRKRKLFTNVNSESGSYRFRGSSWSPVEFKHPASFATLAMEPSRKQSIMTDLIRFRQAKDYYAKIGKAWKRGYLLHGPPGTGKSTMIAAMANLLEYDVYDLELTAVKDNTQLRRLLIETTSKSIVVIEDIDCSLDLTGQRSKKKGKDKDKEEGKEEDDKEELKKKIKELEAGEGKKSEVTLSGLLNFIDGIWSACGEERIIVFTTNYVEKLDPALIRRGRMDMHIELSYCCYEAFKMLARNYLDVDSHPLFETIRRLLEKTKMTPADVAENLMPKSLELDVDECLQNLVTALEESREKDKLKAAEEEREKQKAREEEEDKVKQEEKKKEANGHVEKLDQGKQDMEANGRVES